MDSPSPFVKRGWDLSGYVTEDGQPDLSVDIRGFWVRASFWFGTGTGKGRHFLPKSSCVADYLIGSWNLGNISSWRSGRYVTFGEMVQVSDPSESIPAGYFWNPAAFLLH
jgi:hypothetical protein